MTLPLHFNSLSEVSDARSTFKKDVEMLLEISEWPLSFFMTISRFVMTCKPDRHGGRSETKSAVCYTSYIVYSVSAPQPGMVKFVDLGTEDVT